MANEEHVKRLRKGSRAWNTWRAKQDAETQIDLSGADLSKLNLVDAILSRADLSRADLSDTKLMHAYFSAANLSNANLTSADLNSANLREADLSGANLTDASLAYARIISAKLNGATFTNVHFQETILGDLEMTAAIDLETAKHYAPSTIDFRTFARSETLPLSFLRGVGLSDSLIDYLPSLIGRPIKYYSCFISYSVKDQQFAERIHEGLQSKGIRCWFAPHDMPIGGKIIDEIDAAIRLRDKVLLILSEYSIQSDWVEEEVTKAFEEERKRGHTVLFPIRLDDAVMDTTESWARTLRAQRNIGDFTRWKEHDEYQKSFARVLRDLTVKKD